MKWKLTNRFLMTIMSILFIVIIVNTVLLVMILLNEATKASTDNTFESDANFTRYFTEYMTLENGVPVVSQEGLSILENRQAWIQILDENGSEVVSYFSPADAPSHYRPVDMIQHYKYQEYDKETLIYISSFEQFSYIIGIQKTGVVRYTVTLENSSILSTISKYLLSIIFVDVLIALVAGLLFGSVLTKPLYTMIEGIQQLKNRNFQLRKVKRPGIYKQVFTNLEDVSTELSKQEIERKKLEQMRNEWISNVSHDMKTPLASIQGYAELLKDGVVSDAEREDYARVIERKSIYMRELIDDFNLTMKLRQHEMPLQLSEVRIEKLVRELVIDVLNDPQFSAATISFSSEAPQLTRAIDEHLLKRALLNFIVNAIIHNEPTTMVAVHLKSDGHSALIEIRDHGRGIPADELANVFERYYRGSNTEHIRGTGLGTAIARDIIAAHGGAVTMESRIGEGTTVFIKL